MYHIFFIYSSVDGHLGCFHVLAIVNSAARNIGVHVSLWMMAILWVYPQEWIAGSYGNSIFSFLRNLHTFFHSATTNLHFHQQRMSVLFSPHHRQHLFVFFLMIAILTDMRWHLKIVLTFISVVISDIEHLFMCLLAICMYLEKMSLEFFLLIFFIALFAFLIISCMSW